MSRRIAILLYPGCQSLDVSGPCEVFAGANRYLQAQGKAAAYALSLLAGTREVVTESGLRLVADATPRSVKARLDTLLVPGGFCSAEAKHDPRLLADVRRLAAQSRRVAAVCTGSFVLAAAGLLNGRRATTHWAFCERLARRYPKVEVDPEPIYVRDGRIFTSAGVTAGIDLSLALVEADLGREAALTVARWLVLFLRRPGSQRQFSAHLRGQMAERDGLRRVQGYIADHLDENLGVEALAAVAAMSPRHFARLFKAEVGLTPARYIAQLRLEAARRQLEEGRQSIERVAAACGFGTADTLRRCFKRELKTEPSEYRRRFQSSGPAHTLQ
ncbi:GlxA family transcriptional regulator [Bradyrhizobium diazoefficiens]|nr:GlxA family transcriptional regulator [Bradyrhizobium diazoefficiens]MBR0779211.1 GlxA family transcriptional regulator [Bradyrhizobium diazoefficiens]